MTDWLETNTTLNGKPFSVDRYEFQRQIINDMHPNMDVMKISQVGLTECEIRKALAFLIRNRGVSLIFTLPNEKLYDKISKTRIQPLVAKDSVFNPETSNKPVRSKEVMQFGDSWLFVTGCTEGDATSISADAVFNDEVDLSPQNMLALFNSRLQNSDYKISQRFSTPTFPSYGIDMGFQSSDQHVRLIKCVSCNHWNWPEFNSLFITVPGLPSFVDQPIEIDDSMIDDIDVLNSFVHCEKCRTPLDLSDLASQEWVPRYPGRTHSRGYHITPFTTDRLPVSYILSQLLKYKKRDYLRGFYNTVLGHPYSDGNIRLEVASIEKCFTGQSTVPSVDSIQAVWVGIDMGQTCHIVLGKGNGVSDMHVFSFKSVHVDDVLETVKDICDTYNVVGGSVDRHPYEPTAQEIWKVSKNKILPVEYRGAKEVNLIFDALKDVSHGQVERTMMLDEVVRQIKTRHFPFSGYGQYRNTIIEHLRDMIRDEQPEQPATWKKLTGQDHYFHALGFLLTGPKLQEVIRIRNKEEIRTVAMVITADVKDRTENLPAFQNKPSTDKVIRGIYR